MTADVTKIAGCKTHPAEHMDGPTVRLGVISNQMGAGLDPLAPAPEHYYRVDPVHPTRPRATLPDARNISGPPSKARRSGPKLPGALLATVAAATFALAMQAFHAKPTPKPKPKPNPNPIITLTLSLCLCLSLSLSLSLCLFLTLTLALPLTPSPNP